MVDLGQKGEHLFTFFILYTFHKNGISFLYFIFSLKKLPLRETVTKKLTISWHAYWTSTNDPNIGQIGNLIPLDKNLNSKAGKKSFTEKMTIYNESELEIVKNFIVDYNSLSEWKVENIVDRTNILSSLAYNIIWEME